MSIKLFADKHLTPAEGEVAVKTYHCTALDPIFAWFGVRINGYVTVTNKRLLYYSQGSAGYGVTGNSRSCVEVWLPDACNITQDIGTRFSIPRLILAVLICSAVGAFTNVVLTFAWALFGTSGAAGLGTVRLVIFLQVVLALFCTVRALTTPYDKILRLIFSAAAVGTLFSLQPVLLLGRMAADLTNYYLWGSWLLSAVVGIQFLVSLYFFVRRWYFHLKVAGKNSGMTGAPINISADSLWSLINVASSYAKNMAPAVDTAAMFKELGAIVADIQTLGDFGIKKWQDTTLPAAETDQLTVAPAATPYKRAMRYATILTGTLAVAIAAEGGLAAHRRAVKEAQINALNVQAQVHGSKPLDGSKWAPNLMTKAAAQETAGATAFEHEDYKEAAMFWQQAAADYKTASEAVRALQLAQQDETAYNNSLRTVIRLALNKTVSTVTVEPAVLAELSSYMERNASAEWTRTKEAVDRAEAFKKTEKGAEARAQWQAASKAIEEVRVKIEAAKRNPAQR